MFKLTIIFSVLIHALILFFHIKGHSVQMENAQSRKQIPVKIKKREKKKTKTKKANRGIGKVSLKDLAITPKSLEEKEKDFIFASGSEVVHLSARLRMIQYDYALREKSILGHCHIFLNFNKKGFMAKKITRCSSPYLNVNLNLELDRLLKNSYFQQMKGKNFEFRVVFDLTTTPDHIGVFELGNIITIREYGAKDKGGKIVKEGLFAIGAVMNILAIPARISEIKKNDQKLNKYRESTYFK